MPIQHRFDLPQLCLNQKGWRQLSPRVSWRRILIALFHAGRGGGAPPRAPVAVAVRSRMIIKARRAYIAYLVDRELRLDEAPEESFPASDPLAAGHSGAFTASGHEGTNNASRKQADSDHEELSMGVDMRVVLTSFQDGRAIVEVHYGDPWQEGPHSAMRTRKTPRPSTVIATAVLLSSIRGPVLFRR
jgi:hypothetical protein